MSLCQHGFTALYDCPYCLRECEECKRLTPESELDGNGHCQACSDEFAPKLPNEKPLR